MRERYIKEQLWRPANPVISPRMGTAGGEDLIIDAFLSTCPRRLRRSLRPVHAGWTRRRFGLGVSGAGQISMVRRDYGPPAVAIQLNRTTTLAARRKRT